LFVITQRQRPGLSLPTQFWIWILIANLLQQLQDHHCLVSLPTFFNILEPPDLECSFPVEISPWKAKPPQPRDREEAPAPATPSKDQAGKFMDFSPEKGQKELATRRASGELLPRQKVHHRPGLDLGI